MGAFSFNPDSAIGAVARVAVKNRETSVAARFFRPQQVAIVPSGFNSPIEKMMNRHSLKGIFIVYSFLISILFVRPIYALNSDIIETVDVVFFFERTLRHAAEEAIGFYPGLRAQLEKSLGWRIHFRPTVILINNNIAFQKMAGSDIIVAFAVPHKDLIVIDYSKMKTDPFTIDATLKHELCHLLLNKYVRRENMPRWLDEGIAQWVSGGLADIIIRQKRSVLNEAILSGRYIEIKALAERFPKDRKSLILAYEESKSFVEYIIREYDLKGLRTLLGYLKEGERMESAVYKSFALSYGELEVRWYNGLKKRMTWHFFLINNLYEILFFITAIILIYGFIRAWIKKRAYGEYEEDGDGLHY